MIFEIVPQREKKELPTAIEPVVVPVPVRRAWNARVNEAQHRPVASALEQVLVDLLGAWRRLRRGIGVRSGAGQPNSERLRRVPFFDDPFARHAFAPRDPSCASLVKIGASLFAEPA